MKKILMALSVIGLIHTSATAQSHSKYDKNYPVCRMNNGAYGICGQEYNGVNNEPLPTTTHEQPVAEKPKKESKYDVNYPVCKYTTGYAVCGEQPKNAIPVQDGTQDMINSENYLNENCSVTYKYHKFTVVYSDPNYCVKDVFIPNTVTQN